MRMQKKGKLSTEGSGVSRLRWCSFECGESCRGQAACGTRNPAQASGLRPAPAGRRLRTQGELSLHSCFYFRLLLLLHLERTRLDAAAEFAELVAGAQPGRGSGGTNPAPREPRDAAEELMEATVLAQEVWRSVQVLLQRVDALGENGADPEVIASSSEMLASSAESQAFFLKAAEEDLCVCADCSALGCEWASVSYGIYLCVDCAGQHRGLGVHLSFVRSLAMDRWTPSQLRRMELGGSLRFRAFLAPFGLGDSSGAGSSCHARYSSRAASYYRRRLDAECRGQAFSDVAPSREEGCQIADPVTFTAEEVETATDGEGESLAAERQQLEEKFLAVQGWLQQVLTPGV
eukprot:s4488_g6.t5